VSDRRPPWARHDRASGAVPFGAVPSGAMFHAELNSYRRRLRGGVFWTTAPLLVQGSVAAGAVFALVVHVGAWPATVWAAAGGAVGVVMSAAWASLRTPSLAATATVVDRWFALEDRIATALQFADAEDAFSRLVVDDARRALEAHRHAPLLAEPRNSVRWLRSAGVAGLLLLLTVVNRPGLAPGVAVSAQNSVRSGGSSDRQMASEENSQSGRERVGTSATGGTGPAAASRSDVADPHNRVASDGGRGGDTRAGTSTSRTSSEAGGSSPQGSFAARGEVPASATVSSGNPGNRAASQGGDGPEGNNGGVPAAGGGSGIGGRATPAPSGSAYASASARARSQAEAAIAAQRVPLRLRAVVRDYFLTIQPTGRQ